MPAHIIDLPASPNLEQQRKRAKDLLKAVRAGEGEALRASRVLIRGSAQARRCATTRVSPTRSG